MIGILSWTMAVIGLWLAAAVCLRRRGDLEGSAYASAEAVLDEIARLGERDTAVCRCESIGTSAEGRSILALRFANSRGSVARSPRFMSPVARPPGFVRSDRTAAALRPRLLVCAQIHAIESIAGLVARTLARRLLAGARSDPEVSALLDVAEIVIVPLLNPDGAARVWRRKGCVRLRDARSTARGVDPNRNFPFAFEPGAGGWNGASTSSRSAYYRGSQPLSEPECRAIARLCAQERFCAAIQLHSIGGVVYLPEPSGPDSDRARHILGTFEGPFQSRQRHLRYRPIHHPPKRTATQLDPFLLDAFGTPSVTVEISRPGLALLWPWYATRLFWWANPPHPARWIDNDVDALIGAMGELLRRSGGVPVTPSRPELARMPEGDLDEVRACHRSET